MSEPDRSTETIGRVDSMALILRVVELAQSRLSRFANRSPGQVRVSYLFRNQYYCGQRFELGPFRATWYHGESEIRFFRGGQPLGTVAVEGGQQRAA